MATGLPADGSCQVWWAPAAAPDDPALLGLLDGGERRRHAELRDPMARGLYLSARAMARLVLGTMLGVPARHLVFRATCRQCGGPHGKPVLAWPTAPVEISVSHSGTWCVVALARHVAVGVDVERIALRGGTLPLRALSPPERRAIEELDPRQRLAAFIHYWTRKEALVKATGDGLTVDLVKITVSRPSSPPALVRWDAAGKPATAPFLTALCAPPGYTAVLASLGRRLRVSGRDGLPILDEVRRNPPAPPLSDQPIREGNPWLTTPVRRP